MPLVPATPFPLVKLKVGPGNVAVPGGVTMFVEILPIPVRVEMLPAREVVNPILHFKILITAFILIV